MSVSFDRKIINWFSFQDVILNRFRIIKIRYSHISNAMKSEHIKLIFKVVMATSYSANLCDLQ
jgi:hypothetical protein